MASRITVIPSLESWPVYAICVCISVMQLWYAIYLSAVANDWSSRLLITNQSTNIWFSGVSRVNGSASKSKLEKFSCLEEWHDASFASCLREKSVWHWLWAAILKPLMISQNLVQGSWRMRMSNLIFKLKETTMLWYWSARSIFNRSDFQEKYWQNHACSQPLYGLAITMKQGLDAVVTHDSR